jgi:hypothetical protein
MMPPTVHPFLWSLLNGADGAPRSLPLPEEEAWETIMSEATTHGFLPLLYRWLKESGSDRELPRSVIDRIKTSAFQLAARNITLAQELASILRLFEFRQVACAPIRGLALAELLYGDITARPMGDIDLLVRKEDLPVVAESLSGLGFREMNRRPGFAQAYSYTLGFFKNRHGGIIVEPHWTIAYPPYTDSLDMEAVWSRCVKRQFLGVETWSLCREDLLLHLCFHALHHDEQAPLLWFYELDRLIRQSGAELDWSRLLLIARQTGQRLILSAVLERLKELFDSPIPDQILSTTQPTPVSAKGGEGAVRRRIAAVLAGDARLDGREEFATFFTIKGLRPKTRYALALLFPSPEFMRLRYGFSGGARLGFCYLTRFMNLTWKGMKWLTALLIVRRLRLLEVLNIRHV